LQENRIEAIGEDLVKVLEVKNEARELALSNSRATIRHCAHSIRASHRGDLEDARALLKSAGDIVSSTRKGLVTTHPDIYWAGYVQDAQKEYAEDNITYAIIAGEPIPADKDLNVEPAAYLKGLGEAAGEMRRYVLDIIRHGRVEECERVLGVMEDIYSLLVTVDFPDAITDGLRRTTDMVRGVLERTRGDVTFAIQQRQLTQALEKSGVHAPPPPTRGEDEEERSDLAPIGG
jgi:translin